MNLFKDTYFERPETSSSDLGLIEKSLSYYLTIKKYGASRNDDHFRFGQLLHCYIFEPEVWNGETKVGEDVVFANPENQDFDDIIRIPIMEKTVQVYKKIDGRTKEGKEQKASLEYKSQLGIIYISEEEMQTIISIKDSILKNEAANNLIFNDEGFLETYKEQIILWKCDEYPDIPLKSKLDCFRVTGKTNDNKIYIIDLKHTSKGIENFPETIQKFNYHTQAAFYRDAVIYQYDNQIFDDDIKYFIVACEGEFPFITRVFELSEEILNLGKQKYLNNLSILNNAITTGNFIDARDNEVNLVTINEKISSVFTARLE